jgi:glycosyltransferase involved in cell wall biosynthesis
MEGHREANSITAVIPAYNAEKFLAATIQSALDQTHQVSEILVVDDGSSDRTSEVAASFPRTRVIRRQNGGQAAARNTGIKAATSEWIAFLDHDDIWFPKKTEVQLKYVTPDAGVIHGNRFDPIHFGNLWHRQAQVTPSGALVRRQALLDVGGFDESRSVMGVEDLNLWLFVRSEEGLFEWKQTGSSLSKNELRMSKAELTCISTIGARVHCQPEEMERIRRASRIEYAKNLIVNRQWDEASELLNDCAPGAASRWLSLAGFLKVNRLAHTKLVKWLQRMEKSHQCSGECDLPEPKRKWCMESCRSPYFRPS